jgi:hypothetical protein
VTDVLPVLVSTTGAVIVSMRRVFYVFQGAINDSVGALELTFADGSVILLDSGADGESLRVSTCPWDDPFLVGAMSPENRDFIAKSGKWSVFDVSESAGYAMLVGSRVEKVEPILRPSGKITGVTFWTAAADLRAEVEADDLYVQLG